MEDKDSVRVSHGNPFTKVAGAKFGDLADCSGSKFDAASGRWHIVVHHSISKCLWKQLECIAASTVDASRWSFSPRNAKWWGNKKIDEAVPEGAESLKVNERCGTKLAPKLLPEILFDTLEWKVVYPTIARALDILLRIRVKIKIIRNHHPVHCFLKVPSLFRHATHHRSLYAMAPTDYGCSCISTTHPKCSMCGLCTHMKGEEWPHPQSPTWTSLK